MDRVAMKTHSSQGQVKSYGGKKNIVLKRGQAFRLQHRGDRGLTVRVTRKLKCLRSQYYAKPLLWAE